MTAKITLITTEPEITKLKRGGHSVRFRIPPHDGMPETKSPWKKFPEATTGGLALKYAEEYRQELEDEINNHYTKSDLSLGSYARKWHEDRRKSGEITESTWLREEGLITSIEKTSLAEIPISEIEPADIDQFKIEGQNAGWSKDKQAKTLRKLKQIFKFAESRQVIRYDPSRNVKNVKVIAKERRYLTKEDQKRLLTALETEEKDGPRAAVRIAFSTGFRQGEVLGLQWGDIHLEIGGSYISLRRQLNRSGKLAPPKHNGTGDIPIDDDTAYWLSDWKKTVKQSSGKSASEIEKMPVCCNKKWGYLSLTNFARWWRSFVVAHELGTFDNIYVTRDRSGKNQKHYAGFDGYKFHELRHTVATELLGEGADLRTVQAIMRHKTIRSTEPYLHSINENMVEAMGKMADARREYDAKKEAAQKKHKVTRFSKGAFVPRNPDLG